jgi:paraquat-inducible protein A
MFDFLTFKANGIEIRIDMIASVNILVANGYVILAGVEIVTIFIIPLIILFCLLYLLFYINRGEYPAKGKKIMSLLFVLVPWSMVEIFLVGTLVSLIKITALADIDLGLSFYAYVLFSLSMTAALLHLDKRQLHLQLHSVSLNKNIKRVLQSTHTKQSEKASSVKASNRIQQSWALLLTSVVFYIPANVLPIMNTRILGQDEPSTIIGGVILLWNHGSYPIAIVIFVASILVPVGKFFVLAWLTYSVQTGTTRFTRERMKLYRLAEFIGRWSMVDVFVVIILVSLVQLGNVMTILPGAATLAFSGVVVMTMLAAMRFDSTLIYNNKSVYDYNSTS